jgi:hypothetical protein
LCVATAAGLVTASLTLMVARYFVLGDEVKAPAGPNTWKVLMLVRGKCTAEDARLWTALPQDFGRQHIRSETFRSAELQSKPPDPKHSERRHVQWTPRPGKTPGSFQVRHAFVAAIDPQQAPATAPNDASGPSREYLDAESLAGTEYESITARARDLTVGLGSHTEQAETLFRFVDENVATEPFVDGPAAGAVECLNAGGGDARAKTRLLAAMLRNRGIPARIVTGLPLTKGHEQLAHYWVEAWLSNRWFPMCTVYHHFGRVPSTFLVFGFGDLSMVRGRHVRDLDYAFLVEKAPEPASGVDPSFLRRFLRAMSFHALPPPEQHLVGFLLLLPVAALIVCVCRNVIGMQSFGTFAPALIGLAFRDLYSLPGLFVFVCILLVGWLMRRALDRYHLLQVPRQAFMLSLVVLILIAAMFVANSRSGSLTTTPYVSLFPLIILTGMIERFWTLETEDSMAASFRALAATVVIAASVALFLSIPAVVRHLFRYPETLGIVMAGQLLLGRYTGYRLSELLRFRELAREEESEYRIQNSESKTQERAEFTI